MPDMAKIDTLAVNPDATVKKKPRGKPFTGKGDPRNNLAGAPKRGESWAEIIDRIGNMTPIEAAEHAQSIAGKLKNMGGAMTLKEAVVIRGYAALLFEPTSSLMNVYMDRTDGKVKDQIDITSNGEAVNLPVDDERYNRAISALADAIREGLSGQDNKPDGKVDTSE